MHNSSFLWCLHPRGRRQPDSRSLRNRPRAPGSLPRRGPRAAPRPGRPSSPRRRRRARSGPQPAAPADPRDQPGGARGSGGGCPPSRLRGPRRPRGQVCAYGGGMGGGGACCAAGPHGARRPPCSAGGDGSSSYSPGGFTAAGVAILSLRRIKTNARGEEGCSEQPGGGGGGEGSRRQGGPGGAGAACCSRPGARRRRSPLRAGRPKMSDGPRAASAHAPRAVSMCRAAAHVRWARVRRRPGGSPPPLAPQGLGRERPSPGSRTSRPPRGSNPRPRGSSQGANSREGEVPGGGPRAGAWGAAHRPRNRGAAAGAQLTSTQN